MTADGTQDGTGAADHDEPYCWGRHLTTNQHIPFSTLQFLHLLWLRGRLEATGEDARRVVPPEAAE